MHPKLGDWGNVPIDSYGVFNLASAFLCVALLAVLLRARRQNGAPSVDLTLLMILGYTALARLLHVVLSSNWEFFTRFSWESLEHGYWGGQIGFGILAAAYLLISRAPFAPLADALGVTWAWITVLHKIGCFLGGCCGGAPTTIPWAMTFPEGGQCHLPGVPIHPSQLYDAGAALVLGALLFIAYWRRRSEGRLLLWWGLGYALTKFASEWFRGDQRFIIVGSVSAAMVVEFAAASVFAFLLLWPGPWNRIMAWRERRSSGCVEPPAAIGRLASFFLGLAGFILAAVASSAAGLLFAWPGAPFLIYLALYLGWNLLGSGNPILRLVRRRLSDGRGASPSVLRRSARAVLAAATPFTFFGMFRPLFDRWGRSLGDAAAGTYLVRSVPQNIPVGNP